MRLVAVVEKEDNLVVVIVVEGTVEGSRGIGRCRFVVNEDMEEEEVRMMTTLKRLLMRRMRRRI